MNELLINVTNGAKQILKAQAVNSNNLANVSTDGFKGELAHIISTELNAGVASSPDFTQGTLRTTGRALDVSINGQGWFAVLNDDGTEGYSRRGDFKIDSFGQLSDGAGRLMIGNNGPISLPPFSKLEIGSDGTISIQPVGQGPNTITTVDRLKLVSSEPGDLHRSRDGTLRMEDPEATLQADASVKVVSGTLEGSNVNAVEEMVKMIDLARQFESQIKLMKSAEENADVLAKLLSPS